MAQAKMSDFKIGSRVARTTNGELGDVVSAQQHLDYLMVRWDISKITTNIMPSHVRLYTGSAAKDSGLKMETIPGLAVIKIDDTPPEPKKIEAKKELPVPKNTDLKIGDRVRVKSGRVCRVIEVGWAHGFIKVSPESGSTKSDISWLSRHELEKITDDPKTVNSPFTPGQMVRHTNSKDVVGWVCRLTIDGGVVVRYNRGATNDTIFQRDELHLIEPAPSVLEAKPEPTFVQIPAKKTPDISKGDRVRHTLDKWVGTVDYVLPDLIMVKKEYGGYDQALPSMLEKVDDDTVQKLTPSNGVITFSDTVRHNTTGAIGIIKGFTGDKESATIEWKSPEGFEYSVPVKDLSKIDGSILESIKNKKDLEISRIELRTGDRVRNVFSDKRGTLQPWSTYGTNVLVKYDGHETGLIVRKDELQKLDGPDSGPLKSSTLIAVGKRARNLKSLKKGVITDLLVKNEKNHLSLTKDAPREGEEIADVQISYDLPEGRVAPDIEMVPVKNIEVLNDNKKEIKVEQVAKFIDIRPKKALVATPVKLSDITVDDIRKSPEILDGKLIMYKHPGFGCKDCRGTKFEVSDPHSSLTYGYDEIAFNRKCAACGAVASTGCVMLHDFVRDIQIIERETTADSIEKEFKRLKDLIVPSTGVPTVQDIRNNPKILNGSTVEFTEPDGWWCSNKCRSNRFLVTAVQKNHHYTENLTIDLSCLKCGSTKMFIRGYEDFGPKGPRGHLIRIVPDAESTLELAAKVLDGKKDSDFVTFDDCFADPNCLAGVKYDGSGVDYCTDCNGCHFIVEKGSSVSHATKEDEREILLNARCCICSQTNGFRVNEEKFYNQSDFMVGSNPSVEPKKQEPAGKPALMFKVGDRVKRENYAGREGSDKGTVRMIKPNSVIIAWDHGYESDYIANSNSNLTLVKNEEDPIGIAVKLGYGKKEAEAAVKPILVPILVPKAKKTELAFPFSAGDYVKNKKEGWVGLIIEVHDSHFLVKIMEKTKNDYAGGKGVLSLFQVESYNFEPFARTPARPAEVADYLRAYRGH